MNVNDKVVIFGERLRVEAVCGAEVLVTYRGRRRWVRKVDCR
jgi:hypothetical protein